MKVKWFNKIQVNTSIVLITLTTLFFTLFCVYYYYTTHRNMIKELEQYGEVTTTRLSKYLERSLWSIDKQQIETSLLSEMLEKKIYAIIVRENYNKTVIMAMSRDKNWNVTEIDHAVSGEYMKNTKQVSYKNKIIGSVEVYLSDKFIRAESFRFILNIVIAMIILEGLIIGALLLILNRQLLKPLTMLTLATNKMSLGEIDEPLNIESKNEIAVLAEAFERMRVSTQMAINLIKK